MRKPYVTFEAWWEQFQYHAYKHGAGKLGNMIEYREYYDDEDTPEEAAKMEANYIKRGQLQLERKSNSV